MAMMIKIREVIDYLDAEGIVYRYVGAEEFGFSGFCPLNRLKNNSITWVRNANNLNVEELNCAENIVLVADLEAEVQGHQFPIVFAENPHRTFFRIVSHFFSDLDPEIRTAAISPTAVIETDDVGEDVFIGHHTYIGKNVKLGNRVRILHNVTIDGYVVIGDDTTIESGTTIGACGYGHYWDEQNRPIDVPHFGGVIIGSHVKIGANNTISRGCLADTIIEDYVKTDNLVHIAHNDYIKYGAMLTACVEISGSTIVGRNAWLAPGTSVREGIELGDDIYTGIGTAITKSQPAGKVIVGVPGKVLRDRRPNEH